jgi:glycosyltransferase involved in cell wall biosynthesis
MIEQVEVALSPVIDLHTGYHSAILDSVVLGTSITPKPATHIFVHDACDGFSPHAQRHYGEFIALDSHVGVVHSARWPVLGCPAWLADTDDLMYPVLCGRTAHNPEFRTRMRNQADGEMRVALRRRVELLTAGYAHSSCLGILLRGHPQDSVRDAREWFDWLDADVNEEFFRKIIPVRPAQKAISGETFSEKWDGSESTTVIFCGRDFEYKNGHLALKAMRPLLDSYSSLRFIYIGNVPDDVASNEPELLRGVEHYQRMNHREVLAALRRSHIFFHPSRGDSIGISLLEAMGAGLAVVVASGGAMEYTEELFGSGGALLLDRDSPGPSDEQATFSAMLDKLVTDRPLARELALRNLLATSAGEFSIGAQSARLATMYRAAAKSVASPALQLSDLPGLENLSITRMNSDEVWRDMRAYRESTGEGAGYKCIFV